VSAGGPCQVLSVHKDLFLNLVNRCPEITLIISRSISDHLRKSDRQLIKVLRVKNKQLETAYRQLKATQEELLRKERLSVLGRLVSTILHDVKNPLSTIRGYAQLIQSRLKGDQKVMKYSDTIISQVDRLTVMTQELLTFARGKIVLNRDKAHLGKLLEDFVEFISPEFISLDMMIETEIDYDGVLNIDRARFHRVLENIAGNAMNAMNRGGTLKISTRADDYKVYISLADNGSGMIKEVRERIFEEFYTHGKSAGTGLGLAITKQVIDEHGGKITVESAPGVGTTFTIEMDKV
jgi:signal transduction histidine kinase